MQKMKIEMWAKSTLKEPLSKSNPNFTQQQARTIT